MEIKFGNFRGPERGLLVGRHSAKMHVDFVSFEVSGGRQKAGHSGKKAFIYFLQECDKLCGLSTLMVF